MLSWSSFTFLTILVIFTNFLASLSLISFPFFYNKKSEKGFFYSSKFKDWTSLRAIYESPF